MSDILKALLITFLIFVGIGLIILFTIFICNLIKLYPTVMGFIGLGILITVIVLLVFCIVYSMIIGGF